MAWVNNENHEEENLPASDDLGLRSATLQKPFQKNVIPLSQHESSHITNAGCSTVL